MTVLIQPLGDSAATISWPEADGLESDSHPGPDLLANESEAIVASRVSALTESLQKNWKPGFLCVVPAFASVTLHYSPHVLSWGAVCDGIQTAVSDVHKASAFNSRTVEIPVCYSHEFATDLKELLHTHELTHDEFVSLHSNAVYMVRMIGFSPGFPYLAGLPPRMVTARRKTPRTQVPVGSVAIGGRQTGIYSLATPGGWNIIGRTPIAMFRPAEDPPSLLKPGDIVKFRPVSVQEFSRLQAQP